MRTSPTIQRYKSAEELAAGFLSLEKRFGVAPERRIDLPENMDDAEAMRAVFTRLGLPDKAEGYGLAMPEGSTDDDKALLGSFTEAAFKLGVPGSQAKGLFEWFAKTGAERALAEQAASTARLEEGNAALQKAWGGAFDQTQRELDTFIEANFSPANAKALSRENRGMYPELMQDLAKLVGKIAEPQTAGPGGGGADGGDRQMTPDRAKAAVRELEADPVKGKALMDNTHPQHKAVVKERSRLLAMGEGRKPA